MVQTFDSGLTALQGFALCLDIATRRPEIWTNMQVRHRLCCRKKIRGADVVRLRKRNQPVPLQYRKPRRMTAAARLQAFES